MIPKPLPIRDERWLVHLRSEPCLLTGVYGSDYESVVAAHIGTRGRSVKSSDDEAIPLCDRLHKLGHQKGEVTMLRENAPDWLIREAFRAYAREMYREYVRSATGTTTTAAAGPRDAVSA